MAVLEASPSFLSFLEQLEGHDGQLSDVSQSLSFKAFYALARSHAHTGHFPQRILLPAAPNLDFLSQLLGYLAAGHLVIPYPPDYPDEMVRGLEQKYNAMQKPQVSGCAWNSDGCLGLLTSGSTGDAKVVLMGAKEVFFNVRAVVQNMGLKAPGHLGVFLPLNHSFGLITQVFPLLLQGGSLFLAPKLRLPGEIAQFLISHKIETLAGVPTLFKLLRMGHLEPFEWVKHITVAGAALSPHFAHEIKQLFPHARLWVGYGLTEAGPRVTALSDQDTVFTQGSVGKPLPGIQLKIENGEIWVQSPSNMLGYLDEPKASEEALMGSWLRSGDQGHIDALGHLHITGRQDDLFQSGGEKIVPLMLEKILAQSPAIHQAAIAKQADEYLGFKIVAYLQFEANQALDRKALKAFCREHLPANQWPHLFYKVTDLPLTHNGKLKRRELDSWPKQKV